MAVNNRAVAEVCINNALEIIQAADKALEIVPVVVDLVDLLQAAVVAQDPEALPLVNFPISILIR